MIPTPTPTGDPADLPLPYLTNLPADATGYQLAVPAPEALLNLTNSARERLMIVNGDNQPGEYDIDARERWSWLVEGVAGDTIAITDAIESALLKAYPDSLPSSQIVLKSEYQDWWIEYQNPFVRPYPPRYARDAAIFHINAQKQPLKPKNSVDISSLISLVPYPAELDGTPGQEWVIFLSTPAMDSRYNGFALWQAVDELPGPQYVSLGNPIIAEHHFWPETYQVLDLTRDSRTDLIVTGKASGAGAFRTNFWVYQWTPTGFKPMSHIVHWEDMYSEVLEKESYIEFITHPPALRLVSDVRQPWGCVYKGIVVYRWTGGFEQRIEQNTMDPDSPACLLGRAVYTFASDRMDIVTTLNRLERALAGLNAKDPADQPKALFAHYYLAILESARGNDAASRRHLEALVQGFADDPSTEQYLKKTLIPLLAGPTVKAMDLCSLGYYAPKTIFSAWRTGLYYPGYFGGPRPEDICSPYDLIKWSLQAFPTTGTSSPEVILRSAGLHVQAVEQVEIPGLGQPLGLAVIEDEPRNLTLVGFIPTEKGIRWERLESFSFSSEPAKWQVSDVTGDGAMDIAVTFQTDDNGNCQYNEHAYEVFIAGRFQPDSEDFASATIHLCNPDKIPLDLQELMADRSGDGLSDRLLQALDHQRSRMNALVMPEHPGLEKPVWFTDDALFDQFRAIEESETELLSALYNNGDPVKTRARLLALRQALLPGPPGRNARQQIDYLIALSYELEGQNEEAVKRYLDLARETPQTLWSNLAAIKIQRK